MRIRRIYVAGPMTGLPEFNYPAFKAAAAKLRDEGHEVENPAEYDAPPQCGTWAGWMRLGIAKLIRCDEIALLPGWESSRGAQLELKLAFDLGMRVRYLGAA